MQPVAGLVAHALLTIERLQPRNTRQRNGNVGRVNSWRVSRPNGLVKFDQDARNDPTNHRDSATMACGDRGIRCFLPTGREINGTIPRAQPVERNLQSSDLRLIEHHRAPRLTLLTLGLLVVGHRLFLRFAPPAPDWRDGRQSEPAVPPKEAGRTRRAATKWRT